MSVTMGYCGDMSPKEYPLRISLRRISSGQQMPLTAYRGRIWGTVLRKNSLKHSLTLFAQPERLRQPQFWLNLTLQPKLWLRWNSFFYRWVSNLNLQFTTQFIRLPWMHFEEAFASHPSSTSDTSMTQKPTSSAYVA